MDSMEKDGSKKETRKIMKNERVKKDGEEQRLQKEGIRATWHEAVQQRW